MPLTKYITAHCRLKKRNFIVIRRCILNITHTFFRIIFIEIHYETLNYLLNEFKNKGSSFQEKCKQM